MKRFDGFQIFCLFVATTLALHWPLSHWFYSDLYHRTFGFAPGSYDPNFVKIIGVMGIMPVAGLVYSAFRPAESGAFFFAFVIWCFAMAACYVYLINTDGFPTLEYVNAALVALTGIAAAYFRRRASRSVQ